ncbi:MAG: hypothetical protein JWM87_724 [Candidatus Eremiobacteraeota bacterium]|nr:hypothetical protein [Candidatus Eremiobacteraeota bacterium]
MTYVLAAARCLTVSDPRYGRAFALEPGELIFDPYLVELTMRAGIRLRRV